MNVATAAPVWAETSDSGLPESAETLAVQTHVVERARDFGQLFSQALDDTLNALAHSCPEQYLQLLAARRREDGGADRVGGRNSAVVQDLCQHLAFEILQVTRRYANVLANVGDYPAGAKALGRYGATARKESPVRGTE